jgi:alkylation response protein AidB-like acyl-CoA dehydrogenase
METGPLAARAVSGEISRRAMETERQGTLPADLVALLREAGLFGLAVPKSLGGAELPAAVIVETGEELARADGSIGWTTMLANATAFLAWLEPGIATNLLADRPKAATATGFMPSGSLTTGLELSGRWPFASGCRHADLFVNAAVRGQDWCFAVLPAETCEIVDNWDVAGLRGTGSHDVLANRIVVCEQQLFSAKDFARHDGPLWRLPFFTLCAVLMAGFPLGVGRRALDELALLAVSKVRPPSRVPVAEDGDLQLAVARAEGGLRSARAFVFDAIGAVWDSALRGDVPQTSIRAEFLLSVQQAMWAALAAVDAAFSYAGAGALRLEHPVQRCFRDLHAASQHTLFTPASAKRYACARLGLAQDSSWF